MHTSSVLQHNKLTTICNSNNYSFSWGPISEVKSITCHMGSYGVTCHRLKVNVLHLKTSWAGPYSVY